MGERAPRAATAGHARVARPLMSMMPRDGDRLPRDEDGPDRRLPLSYRTDNGSRDSEFYLEPLGNATADAAIEKVPNPFFDIVAQLYAVGAHEPLRQHRARVRAGRGAHDDPRAARLDRHAFETATVTSAERLANLMFQLQMTGYMFKNAEYRLSITESLEGLPQLEPASDDEDVEVPESGPLPKVEGKIRVQMSEGMEVRQTRARARPPAAPSACEPCSLVSSFRLKWTRTRTWRELRQEARFRG